MVKKRSRRTIDRELPPVGTELKGKFKGAGGYKAKIVKDPNCPTKRLIEFNGKLYPSMTAAAIAITKQPTNGWRFWKLNK
jgi:hypothetical protein